MVEHGTTAGPIAASSPARLAGEGSCRTCASAPTISAAGAT